MEEWWGEGGVGMGHSGVVSVVGGGLTGLNGVTSLRHVLETHVPGSYKVCLWDCCRVMALGWGCHRAACVVLNKTIGEKVQFDAVTLVART